MTVGGLYDHVPDEIKWRVQEGADLVGTTRQAWSCDDRGHFVSWAAQRLDVAASVLAPQELRAGPPPDHNGR